MGQYAYEYDASERISEDADMGPVDGVEVPMSEVDRQYLVDSFYEGDDDAESHKHCTKWVVYRFIEGRENDNSPVYVIGYYPCAADNTSSHDVPFEHDCDSQGDGTMEYDAIVSMLQNGCFHIEQGKIYNR
jgi:hypothetical protein